jgi:hypothetical protein
MRANSNMKLIGPSNQKYPRQSQAQNKMKVFKDSSIPDWKKIAAEKETRRLESQEIWKKKFRQFCMANGVLNLIITYLPHVELRRLQVMSKSFYKETVPQSITKCNSLT